MADFAKGGAVVDAGVAIGRTPPETVVFLLEGSGPGPAPTVTFESPAPGSSIGRRTPLVFSVEDDLLAFSIVSLVYASGLVEVAYRAGAFTRAFTGSSVVVVGDVTRWTLVRVAGWPSSVTVLVDVVDAEGQTA